MNIDWLQRLRWGARLLFWSQLAAYLLPNVFGFLVAFLGGVLSDLRWGSLIYTLASLPALFGVFALSSRCPQGAPVRPLREAVRWACGILATLELLRSIIRTVLRVLVDHEVTLELEYHFRLVGVLAVVAVLIRLGQLASLLGAAQLGRSFLSVTCVYVALGLAEKLLSGASPEPDGGRAYMLWLWTWMSLYGIVWLWVLVLISRFRCKVDSVMAGNCGSCDYDLTGNLSGICPECGVATER